MSVSINGSRSYLMDLLNNDFEYGYLVPVFESTIGYIYTEDMRRAKNGRVWFVGGKAEKGDINIIETLKREANEEAGITSFEILDVMILPRYGTSVVYVPYVFVKVGTCELNRRTHEGIFMRSAYNVLENLTTGRMSANVKMICERAEWWDRRLNEEMKKIENNSGEHSKGDGPLITDPISQLNMLCQKKWKDVPRFTETRYGGPEHRPIWSVVVTLPNGTTYTAVGPSNVRALRASASLKALENWQEIFIDMTAKPAADPPVEKMSFGAMKAIVYIDGDNMSSSAVMDIIPKFLDVDFRIYKSYDRNLPNIDKVVATNTINSALFEAPSPGNDLADVMMIIDVTTIRFKSDIPIIIASGDKIFHNLTILVDNVKFVSAPKSLQEELERIPKKVIDVETLNTNSTSSTVERATSKSAGDNDNNVGNN